MSWFPFSDVLFARLQCTVVPVATKLIQVICDLLLRDFCTPKCRKPFVISTLKNTLSIFTTFPFTAVTGLSDCIFNIILYKNSSDMNMVTVCMTCIV